MTDNVTLNPGTGGAVVASDDIGGVQYQRIKMGFGVDGAYVDVSATDPLPVTGPLTNAQLRASDVSVTAASLPLPSGAATAAKQPALGTAGVASTDVLTVQGAVSMTALKVDGSAVTQPVSIAASVAVTGPLTNEELRAATVPTVIAPMEALSYNVAGVIAINTILISLDCSQVRSLTLQCVSMGTTGAVTYQWSNDQVTWTNATYQTSAGATSVATITAAGLSVLQVVARYFRVRLTTATTAGTTTFTGFSSDRPIQVPITTQNVNGTVTATATQPFTPTANLLSSAATTNATLVKATAGTIYAISASNTAVTAAFLKIFNLTTAPTVGTSVPALTIPIPATGQVSIEFGPLGIRFGTGISFSITNLIADTDTTAIAAAQVKSIISFV